MLNFFKRKTLAERLVKHITYENTNAFYELFINSFNELSYDDYYTILGALAANDRRKDFSFVSKEIKSNAGSIILSDSDECYSFIADCARSNESFYANTIFYRKNVNHRLHGRHLLLHCYIFDSQISLFTTLSHLKYAVSEGKLSQDCFISEILHYVGRRIITSESTKDDDALYNTLSQLIIAGANPSHLLELLVDEKKIEVANKFMNQGVDFFFFFIKKKKNKIYNINNIQDFTSNLSITYKDMLPDLLTYFFNETKISPIDYLNECVEWQKPYVLEHVGKLS